MSNHKKWVSAWGTATSITDRKETTYAKDLTLRYAVFMPFTGSQLRLRFSNLTGTEAVTISKIVVHSAKCNVQSAKCGEEPVLTIPAGEEVETEPISLAVEAGEKITVSFYLKDYTQMNAGTLVTGPLSGGEYAYGDFAEAEDLPAELSRKTNWYYFLNTIDVLTDEKNKALICYGDSITAQSWPDYLQLQLWEAGKRDTAVIRRAVCGTRILRQYDCITYQAYGLKGETRFPIETNVAGAEAIIIQHGINDIIHPVGVEVNQFRPWSDMPTLEDLKEGYTRLYLDYARKLGLKIYVGTLLPIYGWRTYNEDREALRQAFNQWLREESDADGVIDFDEAVRDSKNPKAFRPGFDSGDHLHPSEKAYAAMAVCALQAH